MRGRIVVAVEAGIFHPLETEPLSQARDVRSGTALALPLSPLDWGLSTLCHTGLFSVWHSWAEVQSENVWSCSFPNANPPCYTLRYKLTRTSQELLAPTEACGSAQDMVVLIGSSQPYLTGLQ